MGAWQVSGEDMPIIETKKEAIAWRKELETGVSFVDKDHKILVNLLNQAYACINQSEESTVLGSILDALLEYTDYHFLREERMMAYAGYAGLAEHKAFHDELRRKVQGFRDSYHNRPADVDTREVHKFLFSWVEDHIKGHDFAYRKTCMDNPDAVAQASQGSFFGDHTQTGLNAWTQVRVMLVDDNPNIRKLIKTLLKAAGLRSVEVVGTPQDGLAHLSRRPVDVVLCDWVMDGMNGTEFARIVGDMALPTQVIMMTGYSAEALRERASGLNIFGFLEKPVKARQVLEMISKAALGKVA